MTIETLDATLDNPHKAPSLKTYLIIITVPMPYPKAFELREEASSIAPAVSRALKNVRKMLRGKRVTEFNIKARQL